jgi:hypothetical protein
MEMLGGRKRALKPETVVSFVSFVSIAALKVQKQTRLASRASLAPQIIDDIAVKEGQGEVSPVDYYRGCEDGVGVQVEDVREEYKICNSVIREYANTRIHTKHPMTCQQISRVRSPRAPSSTP